MIKLQFNYLLKGLIHQNCQLSNRTVSEVLPNDRLYGSTGALYQRTDGANGLSNGRELSTSGQNIRLSSSIPKLLTPIRTALNSMSFNQ